MSDCRIIGNTAAGYGGGLCDCTRVADTEIVLLRASRVVGAYEEAWDLLRGEVGAMPRNVMLVTGPSRSADIEQTLELGAHGPRRLHVVLVEDAAA